MRTHSRTTGTNADSFRRLEVITGVGHRRRRRWSLEDKARIVAESLDPATTASAVARRYGLHASQLFIWRQQLQRSASAAMAVSGPGFVPVLLAEDSMTPAEMAGRMEIALGPAVVRVGAVIRAACPRSGRARGGAASGRAGAGLPDGRPVIILGVAHTLCYTSPAELAAVCRAFIEEDDAARGTEAA